MFSYHGTSKTIATQLAAGNVDVTRGGGELGRGFYTGEHLHLAKAWALHTSGDAKQNVVQFSNTDDDIGSLVLEVLGHGTAALRRYQLRSTSATRTYLFGVDVVWAPIVGTDRVSGDQYKWESTIAESLLNGKSCTRKVI